MNPPIVYDVTKPKTHNTNNTTAIVYNMSALLWLSDRYAADSAYCAVRLLKENFWPATVALYISPPFAIVNTAMP